MMIDFILQNKKGLFKICKAHKVKSLYAFGSVLSDNFSPKSDIDFLYNFDDDIPLEKYSDNFFDFYDQLQLLFNRNIDLVGEKNLSNPYFKKVLDKTKVLVYEG